MTKAIAVIVLGMILGGAVAGAIVAAIPGQQGLGGILLIAFPVGSVVGIGSGIAASRLLLGGDR